MDEATVTKRNHPTLLAADAAQVNHTPGQLVSPKLINLQHQPPRVSQDNCNYEIHTMDDITMRKSLLLHSVNSN